MVFTPGLPWAAAGDAEEAERWATRDAEIAALRAALARGESPEALGWRPAGEAAEALRRRRATG